MGDTCSATGTPATVATTEAGEAGEEDITEAGEAGAEVIIEAGVEVEPQRDFRGDPRPLVEPGQLRDLVGLGGDSLDFCKVYCCDISLLIYKKIQLCLKTKKKNLFLKKKKKKKKKKKV